MSYKVFSPAPNTSSIATLTAFPVTPAAVAAKLTKLPSLAATLLSAFIISIHAVPIDFINALYSSSVYRPCSILFSALLNALPNAEPDKPNSAFILSTSYDVASALMEGPNSIPANKSLNVFPPVVVPFGGFLKNLGGCKFNNSSTIEGSTNVLLPSASYNITPSSVSSNSSSSSVVVVSGTSIPNIKPTSRLLLFNSSCPLAASIYLVAALLVRGPIRPSIGPGSNPASLSKVCAFLTSSLPVGVVVSSFSSTTSSSIVSTLPNFSFTSASSTGLPAPVTPLFSPCPGGVS